MSVADDIEFFFAPPVPPQQGGTFSTLHLLRREVQDCLIGLVIEENAVVAAAQQARHRLFANKNNR